MKELNCPLCGYSKYIPVNKLPIKLTRVICPKCKSEFEYDPSEDDDFTFADMNNENEESTDVDDTDIWDELDLTEYGKKKLKVGIYKGDVEEDVEPEKDELWEDAMRLVLKYGQVNINMLINKLSISHDRATGILCMMELEGMVCPSDGTTKSREVYIDIVRAHLETDFNYNDGDNSILFKLKSIFR